MGAQSQSGIIKTAVPIAEARGKLLGRIRELLEVGNDREALRLMKLYVRVTDEQKGNRASPRLN